MKRFMQILAAVVLLGTETAVAMPIGLRMVFWNNHSERAENIVIDAGGGKTVSVPMAWIAEHPALVAVAGGDAEEAVQHGVAANGRKVWQCYVVGLDPEVATNDFKITSFPMKEDGKPDLDNITFTPPKSEWNMQNAEPKLKGKAQLDAGEWQDVPKGGDPAMRFFKIEVELP